jgi:hypothetical protein
MQAALCFALSHLIRAGELCRYVFVPTSDVARWYAEGSLMRTVIIILGGFVLLAVCFGVARFIGSHVATATGTAVKIFMTIWFVVAAVNMWIGVAQAGYSFTEELPIFLLIFLLPAAAAILIKWKFF